MSSNKSIRRLAIPFAEALARLLTDSTSLRDKLKTAKKAREAGKPEGDFLLTDKPVTIGSVAAGARSMPIGMTWGSSVGPNMAENFGIEIVDWNLRPEDMFSFLLWGATPQEGADVIGRQCFEAAEKFGLFDIAFEALSAINVKRIRRPLVAASNVYAYFTSALHGISEADAIMALQGVSPYVFGTLQAAYCNAKVLPHSEITSGPLAGKLFASSFAEEHVTALGELVSAEAYRGAVDFVNLYLVQLATHGANFGELAAFRRQQGDSEFNPIGSLQAGFEHLSADAHGGAQSLVLGMMFNAMEYCEQHGRSRDSLLAWAKTRNGLFMGLGHAKYREPDPRGMLLSAHAKTVRTIAEDKRFTYFEFFLEHIGGILSEVKPSITNKNPNVDFWAALLQYLFLGITNPEALELLFGLARVPAYIKAAYTCMLLGIAIERPDEVTLDQLVSLTGATHPFSNSAIFQ